MWKYSSKPIIEDMYTNLLEPKIPPHIEEENRLITKHLYPIMYSVKGTDRKVIYTDELESLLKNLKENIAIKLEEIIEKKEFIVVDANLSEEEQKSYIKQVVTGKIEYEKFSFIRTMPTEEIKNDSTSKIEKETSEIIVGPLDIATYLSSDIKKEVNMAMKFDMAYIIEKLKVDDDKTRALVILDTVINDKSNILTGPVINRNVINVSIMGIPLTTILDYYKVYLFGYSNSIIDEEAIGYIETLQEVFKPTYNVSKNEMMEYTRSVIEQINVQQEEPKKKM